MKNQDVLCKVLSEVFGKPESEIQNTFNAMKIARPDIAEGLEKEISDQEGEDRIKLLLTEKSGILNWCVEGYQMYLKEDFKG